MEILDGGKRDSKIVEKERWWALVGVERRKE
jgi:hypothetical protein